MDGITVTFDEHRNVIEVAGPSWNVDATVTARRRRRANTLRMFAVGSFLSAIAWVGVLHHASTIAFGPWRAQSRSWPEMKPNCPVIG